MIVVTRHKALVEYLQEKGYVGSAVKVIPYIKSISEISGEIVIGVLPLHLAVYCKEVWEVPLDLPLELREVELGIKDIWRYANPIQCYQVKNLRELT